MLSQNAEIEISFLSDRNGIRIPVITVKGIIPQGSDGNKIICMLKMILVKNLTSVLPELFSRAIFDFSSLEYEWGDSIIELWITVFRKGYKPIVVAHGNTKSALEGLNGLSINLPFCDTTQSACLFKIDSWKYFG